MRLHPTCNHAQCIGAQRATPAQLLLLHHTARPVLKFAGATYGRKGSHLRAAVQERSRKPIKPWRRGSSTLPPRLPVVRDAISLAAVAEQVLFFFFHKSVVECWQCKVGLDDQRTLGYRMNAAGTRLFAVLCIQGPAGSLPVWLATWYRASRLSFRHSCAATSTNQHLKP